MTAEHRGTGSFRVDEGAMARRLKMERGKLWRHRVGVVWSVFATPLTIISWGGCGSFIGWKMFNPGLIEKCAGIVVGFFLAFFIPGIIFLVMNHIWMKFLGPRVRFIRARWTPPTWTPGGKDE